MSNCSRHENEEAVGFCVNCGELVCAICHKEIDGKGYCTVCADKLFASTEVKSEQTPPPAPAEPTVPSVPLAARPASVRAKKAKIEAAPVVQVAKVVEPVTLAEKPASEPAKPNLVPQGVKQPVSNLWWLLPLLFTWIGGVIAGLFTKGRDSKKALNMFLTGLGMTFVHGIVIIALLAGSAPPPPEQSPTSSTDQTSSVTSTADQQTTASSSNPKTSGTTTGGQTQVGQTPVATNGQDIEVMGPSNTQSESPPPPTDYKLTTLSDQAVQPSDKDQMVSYADKLQVTIPGGQLKESQKLVISAVGNPPAPSSHETQLAVYDISFEKQHEFDSNLTFKFAYDPALVVGDLPPQETLHVATFYDDARAWVPVPSTVDPASNTITVQTPHNGMWQVVKTTGRQNVVLTEHCAIFYYPLDFFPPKVVEYDNLERTFQLAKTWKERGMIHALQSMSQEDKDRLLTLSEDQEVKNRVDLRKYSGYIPDPDKHYYTDYPEIPKYVVDIAYAAEKAWEIYKKPGIFGMESYQQNLEIFTPYPTRINVNSRGYSLINPPGDNLANPSNPLGDSYSTIVKAFPIYVKDGWFIHTKYNAYDRCMTVNFGFTLNKGLIEAIAHEMFHGIQHRDYDLMIKLGASIFTQGETRSDWWLEGTAEYAAYKIFEQNAKASSKPITNDWLGETFFMNSALGRTELLEHSYATSYFFDYIAHEYNVDFPAMYNVVKKYLVPAEGLDKYFRSKPDIVPSDMLEQLDPDAPTSHYPAINEVYRKFAAYLVMDAASPAERLTTEKLSPEDYLFGNPVGLTSIVKGISPGVSRTLQVSVKEVTGRPSFLKLDVYKIRAGVWPEIKNTDPEMTWSGEKDFIYSGDVNPTFPKVLGTFYADAADDLYILVTASNENALRSLVRLTIEDKLNPTLSIDPPPEVPKGSKGTTCVPYTFQAWGVDLPRGITYKWYVDGTEINNVADTSMTMTHAFSPGPHQIKVVARWGEGITTEQILATLGFDIAEPKLTINGPKELKEGEKGVTGDTYTFEVEPEYVPTSAAYAWSLSGETGKKCYITPLMPGPYTVTVTASWDVNDCKGKKEGSTQFEIEKESIDINANPATATIGQSVTFIATGHVRRNAVFDWNYGDKARSGTEKISTPVSHKYASEGKYNVKVTAMDNQGNTVATKTIQYLVNPAAGVKIIGPGGTGNINDEYTFIAKSSPMPVGARIEWYFEGGKKYRDTDTVKHTFTTAGDKTVMVQWVIGNEVVPICKDQIQFTVVAAPTLSIKMPGDGKVLQPDKENIFYAVSTSIPGDAVYEWYINEEGVLKAQGREGTVATAPAGFFKEGDYEILVIAKWKGADLKEQWAQADARFKVATINISLSIIPPPEIQGKTAKENTKYYFAFNTDVPSTATFTWYRDGKEVGGGETIGLAFASGQHTVGLKATWRDSDAARTPREQKAKDLSFNIGAATTLPTGHGWYLVKTVYEYNDRCSQATCAWSECIEVPLPPGTAPSGGNPLGNYYGDNPSTPTPCDQYPITISWTKLPSFLKPNSDFYCSMTISPPEYVDKGTEVVMAVIDENGYAKDLLYENGYYLAGGQQKIWIPDGSRAKVPFSNESKLAGKNLVIRFYGLATFLYEYR